ncbi:hypothetical protein [Streptomyces sp. TRM68367]|uniref:hypothetical protein n=1 Tax=Streptomyces sp. TRM68367 TaxID=2758415 RepID=UPI00165A578E|nr:hypothetical protein [Streptomyces sp. TRM68367]MBC9729268.1 hypothetical protein [Streptomyces sp. TRM68367]
MAIEPVPCAPGPGGEPVEVNVTTCCAPSIASTPLCRQDGTTVLLVVRSGCVECGETAPDPEVVGWIDPATGTFTPGPAPADAGPCDTGCVDTICVQRCDDTDGDGTADQTYNELWCVRADGSTELVLTYQGDPSQPYGPVSPVDCEYGCVETQTYMLCDASGAFLRRITIGAGQHIVEDLELDGLTPHTVTGTVGACGGSGTGTTLPEQDVTILCDTATDGTVTEFVRDYQRDTSGQITGHTDYTLDGQPYTPSGTVGVCGPAEPCSAQSVLHACRCDDTDGDGVGDVDYVELLGVDCTGAVTSLGTYTADLSATYTPVAPVDCDAGDLGAEPATAVQARRVQLAAGETWDAAAHPTLRSVTATAHTGTGTISTVDGASTLFQGESVTWAIDKDEDARLMGPLTITANTGTTTVAYTTGVTL